MNTLQQDTSNDHELSEWAARREQASRNIRKGLALAALFFLLMGVQGTVRAYRHGQDTLRDLSGFAATELLTDTIYGPNMTIAAVRQRIQWNVWNPIALNCAIVCVLAIAFVWSRRRPLAALSMTFAAYLAVFAIRAWDDPGAIEREAIVGIIFSAALFKSFKTWFDLGRMPKLQD